MSFIYCHLNFHANLLRPWPFPLINLCFPFWQKPVESSITKKLTEAFKPQYLEVINESHMHNVPKGSTCSIYYFGLSRSFYMYIFYMLIHHFTCNRKPCPYWKCADITVWHNSMLLISRLQKYFWIADIYTIDMSPIVSYNWIIVESGVKHHKPNQPFIIASSLLKTDLP